jgi:hypothetical protein
MNIPLVKPFLPPKKVLLNNLSKAPLMPVNHPFLDESVHHEI